MSANQFGDFFSITTFGESHGVGLGVVIDGCPAGVSFDLDLLHRALQKRRPGQSKITTDRQESDQSEILSGVYQGRTLGTPITILTRNHDARSEDYLNEDWKDRPGHADDLWREKFGHSDPRGGGRSSGRETIGRVMAGAVAQMFCQSLFPQMQVVGWTDRIGPIVENLDLMTVEDLYKNKKVDFLSRFLTFDADQKAQALLLDAKQNGYSYGGVARALVINVPKGIGEPVFGKLKSKLASAILSIGATNGFEIGSGFTAAEAEGTKYHSHHNNSFHQLPLDLSQRSSYGGDRGGISTGEPIDMRVSFKPTSSVLDVAKKGRHDPCIVPRAIAVVEAMIWLVLADLILAKRLNQLEHSLDQ